MSTIFFHIISFLGKKKKKVIERQIVYWFSLQLLSETFLTLSRTERDINVPYILESNPHPFYSFRGLKNQMRIRMACGLDSRSRAGFWKNDRAAVRAVRTIQ